MLPFSLSITASCLKLVSTYLKGFVCREQLISVFPVIVLKLLINFKIYVKRRIKKNYKTITVLNF